MGKRYSIEEQQRRAKINKRKKMLRAPLVVVEKIFKNVKDFYEDKIKYPIIWFIQRGKRGYCDRDTWDFERWFFDVAPKIIKKIESYHCAFYINGYDKKPVNFDKQFLEMARCFEKANSLDSDFKNTEEYKKYEKYRKRGLELFVKYLDYLWW